MRLLEHPRSRRRVNAPSERGEVPPIDHRVHPEVRPCVRNALDDDLARPRDLPPKQWRRLRDVHRVDGAADRPLDPVEGGFPLGVRAALAPRERYIDVCSTARDP